MHNIKLYNITTMDSLDVKKLTLITLSEETFEQKRCYVSILDFLMLFKK